MRMDELLHIMIERGASDLHIKVGSPPGLRIYGDLIPLEDFPMLEPEDTERLIQEITTEEQRAIFQRDKELDLAYSVPGLSRFRVNVFQQRGVLGAVLRAIPIKVMTIEELKLPPVVKELASKPRGLVLVTGPTGSGKSTTLAAMIDYINATERLHIVTMEDPIEFWHEDKLSYVNQREIKYDTKSFQDALTHVLRQDPDVILVGEIRELETVTAAITAAETGHLVLGTVHTTSASQTVDRLIDIYPPHQQQQIKMQLSLVLEGVLSQTLLRRKDGRGRQLAMEIMVMTPAIRNLIREGKVHQIPTQIQTGSLYGMQTLDQALRNLYQKGLISREVAMENAGNREELTRMLR